MSRKFQRCYEVKSGDHTDIAIRRGKNAIEFERLHTGLAEELTPDGLLEEDAVLTIAKCIWRKRKRILPRVSKRRFYNKKAQQDLLAFHKVLVEGAAEHKIRHQIQCQQLFWEYRFLRDFPRQDFENTEAWAAALAEAIKDSLLPHIAHVLEGAEEAYVRREIPGPTCDELFDRELRFDERNEAALQRAIDRLLELKQAKQPISFRAMQRFERTHPDRLNVKIVR